MSIPHELIVGNVVALRSGGPAMTVAGFYANARGTPVVLCVMWREKKYGFALTYLEFQREQLFRLDGTMPMVDGVTFAEEEAE